MTLSGFVRHSVTGQGIENALVEILTGASAGRGVRSGNNGAFLIEGIAIGEARTQATATGYANETKTFDMRSDTVHIYEMRAN